jgi:hypothetical protein
MPASGRAPKQVLFSALPIRNTTLVTSPNVAIQRGGILHLAFKSTLDQAGTLIYQGSMDGGTSWLTLKTVALTAAGEDWQTVEDPWDFVRATFQASVNPASGIFSGWAKWAQDS